MAKLQSVALVWVGFVLALVAVHVLLPQRFGVFALTQILEPYLVLTGVIAGVIAFGRASTARFLVLLAFGVAVVRYAPAWVSFPSTPGDEPIRVAFWNMEAGHDAATRALAGVTSSNAQLIGLAELQPEAATALESSGPRERFPFQALSPSENVLGVGLLSQYPILEHETTTDPPLMRALVDPPSGDPIVVYVAHPLPARFMRLGSIPIGVDTSVREVAISLIRSRVEDEIAAGRSVIVLGDLNTTEREPAYVELSSGLRDAHLDAGVGPGFTWRLGALSVLPFGLLRIDYVLSTSDLLPTSSSVDCSLPSDHCRVDVALVMTRTGGAD